MRIGASQDSRFEKGFNGMRESAVMKQVLEKCKQDQNQ